MALDISKLEDHTIMDCRTADDAQAILWFFAAIRDILDADCKCGTAKVEDPKTGQHREVPFTCWPCVLRAARDKEDWYAVQE